MADIVYKKSLYDRFCRTLVGMGLLYGAFSGGKAWQDYQHSKEPYQVVAAGDIYLLMERQSRKTAPIRSEIFSSDLEQQTGMKNQQTDERHQDTLEKRITSK